MKDKPGYCTGECRTDFSEKKLCPRCLKPLPLCMGAISRRDNATEICPECGVEEAFEDLSKREKTK